MRFDDIEWFLDAAVAMVATYGSRKTSAYPAHDGPSMLLAIGVVATRGWHDVTRDDEALWHGGCRLAWEQMTPAQRETLCSMYRGIFPEFMHPRCP